jgi:hypothetical protein
MKLTRKKSSSKLLILALLAAGSATVFAQPPGGGGPPPGGGEDTSDAVTDGIEVRAYEPTEVPDRITVTICGDPSTQMAVNWRTTSDVLETESTSADVATYLSTEVTTYATNDTVVTTNTTTVITTNISTVVSTDILFGSTNIVAGSATVEIALASGSSELEDDTNIVRTIVSDVALESDDYTAWHHSAVFDGLEPGAKYVYRVGNDVLNADSEEETIWSEWNNFCTAESSTAGSVTPFSFVYFGDAQNGVKSHWSRCIREAYSDLPDAKFFLHAGDLIDTADNDQEWGEWFYAGGWINATMPQVATPGNHEYDGGAITDHWRPHFTFPENGPTNSLDVSETVYHFDYQGVRFISLDTECMAESSATNAALAQATWLEGVLAENPNKWTIVYHHKPVWQAAEDREQHPFLETCFKPIYETYGVDLVLQGHDHTYARGDNLNTGLSYYQSDNGPVYVVSVAGEKMYDSDASSWADVTGQDTQLYQLIEVYDEAIRYRSLTAAGEDYDEFYITKADADFAVNTLAMGDLEMYSSNGVMNLNLQLEGCTNLTDGSWSAVGEPVDWEIDTSKAGFFRVRSSK